MGIEILALETNLIQSHVLQHTKGGFRVKAGCYLGGEGLLPSPLKGLTFFFHVPSCHSYDTS